MCEKEAGKHQLWQLQQIQLAAGARVSTTDELRQTVSVLLPALKAEMARLSNNVWPAQALVRLSSNVA
jgi:hypothetical protein